MFPSPPLANVRYTSHAHAKYFMDPYSDDDSEKPESKSSEESGTELLPNSFFPDKPEPGKICKIRVEKVYGDQSSVSYVHDKDDTYEDEPAVPDRGVMGDIEEMTA